ncbi:MAG TPA: DUF4112 domain-containing protein [Blastocatellia bacterium]|jgi:hypothetical protein|nr:DUF4112 domain-containing protein [Blastocatellia bacterium]
MGKAADNTTRNDVDQSLARAGAGDRVSVQDRLREFADAPIDKHLERIGFLLDRAIKIPGTDIRVGLDPILGFFLPVVGDWVGGLVGVYVILASIRHGLPKSVITRMVFNVGVDFMAGSVPIVGDAFDFLWKSNTKNLRLLNKYAAGKKRSVWSDWAWVLILLGCLALLMIGLVGFAVYALKSTGIRLV